MARPKGFKHTEETKAKMRMWHSVNTYSHWTGKKLTQKHKQKIRVGVIKAYTPEVKQKILLSLPRGEKHWYYKKDRTTLKTDRQHQFDSRYTCWMKEVKNRDSWKCRISNGSCSGRLEAHHILSWSKFVELRYEINNGITLCHFHHPIKNSEVERLSPYFQQLVENKVN